MYQNNLEDLIYRLFSSDSISLEEGPRICITENSQAPLKLLVQSLQSEILEYRENLDNRDVEKWVWFSQHYYKHSWIGEYRKALYANMVKTVLYVVGSKWLKSSELSISCIFEIMLTVFG